MNKIVFERQTTKGYLSCQIKSEYLSQCNFTVEFYLDGVFIPKNYNAGIAINILTLDFLKDKEFAKEIYPKLVSLGATALWNGKIALFNDEPELIREALKHAEAEREAEEELQLKETDIIVTKRLYNHSPANAENDKFSWFHGQPESLKCKKTGKFIYQCQGVDDDDTLQAARKFRSDLYLITKAAEKSYAKAQKEKEQAKREQRGENPWTKGLSTEEIQQKAKEWDDVNNEGGEGYNPYLYW